MVALSEVTNTFWGVTLDGDGKRYSQVVEHDFHVSMAALEISSSKNVKDGSYVSVMIQQDNTEFLLCTLQHGKLLQQSLDLNFAEGEEITFFLNGKGVVHLTGYLMEANMPDSMEFDQEEEVESEEYSSDEEPPSLVRRGITAKEYEESDEEMSAKGKRKKKDVGAIKAKKAKVEESEESSDEEEDDEMDSDDLDSDDLNFLEDEAEEVSDEDDDDDDDFDDDDEDEEELIRMSGSFLKAEKSNAKQKQKNQVGKTDKGTPKSEQNTPVAKQQDKKQTPGGKKQMQAGQKQTPAGQKQTSAGQKQTPAGQKQTPAGQKQTPAGQKQTPAGQKQTPAGQKQTTAGQKQTPAGQKQTPAGQKQTPAGQKEGTPKQSDNATPTSSEPELSSEKKKKKKKKKKKQQKTDQETPNNKLESKTPKQTPGGDTNSSSQKKPQKQVLEGGVICEESKEGHGPSAMNGKTVHVYYTGKLENGKIFDSTKDGKPFKFKLGLNEVIRGWDIGIKGMKVGGKRKLVIPAKMAYGKEKVGNIPPNSTLIFEVELKAVS